MHSTMWKKGEGETFWILNLSAWVSLNERADCRWWSLNNNKKIWYETKLFCCKPWEMIFSHHPGYLYTLSGNYGLLPPFLLPWNVCFTPAASPLWTLPLLLLYRVPVTFTYFIHSCLLWCFHFVTSHFFLCFFLPSRSLSTHHPPLSFSLTHDLFAAEYHHFISSI